MFTRPVEQVRDTNIFARLEPGGRQVLVYGMYMAGREDVAMILPLPVPTKSAETSVSFIDLSNYPTFLTALWYGFDQQPGDFLGCTAPGKGMTPLPVAQVGRFEASFVPSVGDFSRLDERFRLPAGTWDSLPAYRDYGFAVFKLKPGAQRVHPMAFSFPTRKPDELFFPTVHIHDGKIHALEEFDHHLFCQTNELRDGTLSGWRESRRPAKLFMRMDDCGGTLDGERHCHYRRLRGRLKNGDTWVA